ncbi:MAG: ATP-binding cassette domain-containing protein [Clostridia bacterium]|nr:ATP-binding cassette domain-containing protein [Clostridia bacterium]
MTPVLTAEDVVFRNLIRYPSIQVAEGAAAFITGPSGCGKSTLLRLFNGTYSPDAGTVSYEGSNILWLNPIDLRREILLAGQAAYLFPGTIRDNFRFYAQYRDEAPAAAEKMAESLALCQVPFGPDDCCDKMSGGEKQRVFLAICLSFTPKVLMLDEPTSALDTRTADALMSAVKAHCGGHGVTLLVVSHDSALAERYADQRILLGEAGI